MRRRQRKSLVWSIGLGLLTACQGEGGRDTATGTGETGTATTTDTGTDTSTTDGSGTDTSGTSDTTDTSSSDTTDGGCAGQLGCECHPGDGGGEDYCDGDLICVDGTCENEPVCQNGEVETGEECDDGNDVDNDGCNADCTSSTTEVWTYDFDGGEGDDEARDVFVDADGNVYVTGYTTTASNGTDLLVIKLDSSGQLVWSVNYDGAANGDDVGNGVVADASSVYVVGTTATGGNDADDMFVFRLAAADGAVGWLELVDGDKLVAIDEGSDIAIDSNGDLYVVGSLDDDATNKDVWVAKYLPNGTQQWATTFTGDQNQTDRGLAIAVDAADNVLVAGRQFVANEAQNVFTAKLGSNVGNELWTTSAHVGSADNGWGIGAAPDGRIFVSGTVAAGGTGDDGWVRKYTPAGDEDWTFSTAADGDDEYRRIALDGDGNAVAVGWFPGDGGTDGWMRKLDADGGTLWQHTFVGTDGGDDQAWGVALTGDDEPIVAGSQTVAGSLDIWVKKLDP